jgi:hypothetical protein
MDLKHAINEPQVQRDIRIERLGAEINRKLSGSLFSVKKAKKLS